MTPVALAAVLISAAFHATWNAMLKSTADPSASAALFVGGAALLSGALAVALGGTLPPASWPGVIGSGLVEAVYFVTLSQALQRLPLGTAYGIARGGGQIVTWPVSALVFHEVVDARSATGAVLVGAGLVSTVFDGGRGAGLWWAFACALTIGVYPLTYKFALENGANEAALFAASLLLALPLQLLFLDKAARLARLRAAAVASPGLIALGSLLCAVSFLTFLVALERGGAGRASALRNTSVLFAAGIGWWRGDPLSTRALLAFLAIVVGAVLVAG